jgi:uncharacterized protein
MPEELLVFLKAPRPGTVKTRLASDIGDELAVEVYRALTRAVLNATQPQNRGDFRRVICFAPREAGPEIAVWLGGETLEPQSLGDLGARMDEAFANSFARGAAKTVIVGTDSLEVDRVAVKQAFQALDAADVVIRSAEDGGYTLIGLKKRQTTLFTGVAWSTGVVLEQTLARAAAAGLRVENAGPDSDIDDLAGLRRHWARVAPLLDEGVARRIEDTAFSTRSA